MFRRLTNLTRRVTNWLFSSKFEAARYSTSRSQGEWGQQTQDPRLDYSTTDRSTIQEKSLGFERNNAIANRLADIFEQFTVGPNGLQIIPASTDEEWNQRHTRSWQRWQGYCDLTSLHHFAALQSLVARMWFFVGEVFILKTYGDSRPGRPRIQLIEAHRVRTPPELQTQEGVRIIDGIEIDPRGRPIAYWIHDVKPDGTETYTKRDAKDIIHVFEPHRPGEYRGRPFLTPVLNDLHDLDDLQKFEMGAAKEAGQIANVLINAAGEMTSTAMTRSRVAIGTQDSQANPVTENRTSFIQKIFGPKSIALKKGEDFKQFMSNRPSVTTQQYWDYLTAKICAGVGISKLLVYPWSIQGTVTRADLDIAAGFFRSRSALLAWAFKQVYTWYTDWAIRNEQESSDPPADGSWRECSYRPPRSVNVDVGRNSQARLAELRSGTETWEGLWGELGCDWRERLRQKAKEAAYIRQLATEFKVTPGEIADLAAEALEKQAQTEQANAAKKQETYA